MPIYEYRCETCGCTFELRRARADASAPATCPSGHSTTRRLLSSFALTGTARAMPAGEGCGPGCACAAN
ncbi:MAG TPA: zinc ribbon domain-containing protein [Acidimicrobiales bacterium]|nr:zinc ribbon domain-containing protein [Acidimicrobiales bacterium]